MAKTPSNTSNQSSGAQRTKTRSAKPAEARSESNRQHIKTPSVEQHLTDIRNRLNYLIARQGKTKCKFGHDLGFDKDTVSKYTSGRSIPSLNNLLLMIDDLLITPKQFFDYQDLDPVSLGKACDLFIQLETSDREEILVMMEKFIDRSGKKQK